MHKGFLFFLIVIPLITKASFFDKAITRTNVFPKVFGVNQERDMDIAVCVNGVVAHDVCDLVTPSKSSCGNVSDSSSVTNLVATASNGCSNTYTFTWHYQLNGGTWKALGSGAEVGAPPEFISNVVGTYNVRVTVTDSCGNSKTAKHTLLNYKSSCP